MWASTTRNSVHAGFNHIIYYILTYILTLICSCQWAPQNQVEAFTREWGQEDCKTVRHGQAALNYEALVTHVADDKEQRGMSPSVDYRYYIIIMEREF